jgi:hypothetical protein
MKDWLVKFFSTIIIYGLLVAGSLGVLGLILMGLRFLLKQLGITI